MSSVVLSGDTSGTVTITVPAVAGSNTVTVPAGTGTVAVQGVSTNIVSGTAVASTSGTSIDFTGIPSWVKRITVMFNNVSTNGASLVQVQLGSSGGITNTGYAGITQSSGASQNSSTGFILDTNGNAAYTRYGAVVLNNITANTWSIFGTVGALSTFTAAVGGAVAVASALTTVRITTVNGTDTFDAGSINILYE